MLEDRVVLSTWTVTNSADDVTQNHTLRYAVAHAQGGDTIKLTAAVKDPIVLTHGELVLSQDVTIESVPSRTPTISGGGNSRVFEIAAGASVTLSDLNLIDGDGVAGNPSGTSRDDGLGGAILNLGTLTVSGSTFSSNHADEGGGFYNIGGATAAVSGSTFTNNSASDPNGGGGIFNGGTVTVSGSTFFSNHADTNGGGIFNVGTVTVSGSTFSSNTAGFNGGGIFNEGTAMVSDSIFTSNTAINVGGGIFNEGTLTVSDSKFTSNGGGAIFDNP